MTWPHYALAKSKLTRSHKLAALSALPISTTRRAAYVYASCTYSLIKDEPNTVNQIQHKRYMKIASQQELDPDFADVMNREDM